MRMRPSDEIAPIDLEQHTGRSDHSTATIMMHQFSYGAPRMTDDGTPCAASFQQCTEILGPEIGQHAGSCTKSEWVQQMQRLEEREIGPVRAWLSNAVGKPQHPVLQKSIDWIKQHGDSTNTAVQMLLAELLMAIGLEDEARQTYGDALRDHRLNSPEIGLQE